MDYVIGQEAHQVLVNSFLLAIKKQVRKIYLCPPPHLCSAGELSCIELMPL